ncbi:hypothetical protein [Chryseobacterium wanjuense]
MEFLNGSTMVPDVHSIVLFGQQCFGIFTGSMLLSMDMLLM